MLLFQEKFYIIEKKLVLLEKCLVVLMNFFKY